MNRHKNADRQARYKERKYREGYKQLVVWVKPEDKPRVKEFVERMYAGN
jgi:hypothetical protein